MNLDFQKTSNWEYFLFYHKYYLETNIFPLFNYKKQTAKHIFIPQSVSCYFPALLIETMFLNAFLQNSMYQFFQFHTVYLAEYNQLCKGIFLYGYGILFLIGTKLMDADAKPVRNPAHHAKFRLPDARQNIHDCPLRHS